ncbi:MAG: hypothetical protein M1816_006330 [Peltula sp. TS41687]|nr:MAG: hypothetical protein M1816_006330 [Peltula sp. TS41687]
MALKRPISTTFQSLLSRTSSPSSSASKVLRRSLTSPSLSSSSSNHHSRRLNTSRLFIPPYLHQQHHQPQVVLQHIQQRLSSSSSSSSSTSPSPSPSSQPTSNPPSIKPYTYEEIRTLSTTSSSSSPPSTILIDVREPSEYAGGYIPSAVNMPIQSQPDSLFLSPDEFRDRYGFDKPHPDESEVVFYCKAGVRSHAAARMAVEAGYTRVGEYEGSWMDWVRRGGGRGGEE